jgi:hypothetical protein
MELEKFEKLPNSFLTELSEDEFLKSVNDTATEPIQEGTETKKDTILMDIESHEAPNVNLGGVNVGNFLNEDLGTDIYEAIIIGITSIALNMADIETKKNEFNFSAKEKNTLKPLVKACIENINIQFTNPFEALFWSTAMIVGSKIFVEKGDEIINKFKSKPTTEKKKEVKKEPSKYMLKKQELKKQAQNESK